MSVRYVRGVSRSLAALVVVAGAAGATFVLEPQAAAQGTATPPAKKDDPKKADPKKGDATPAATPTPAPASGAAPAAAGTAEEAKPGEEKEIDDHRAITLSAEIGFARADIGALTDNTGFNKTGANGVAAGLGIGYRYKDFRIGGRFRDTSTTEYSLWALMGEIGYGLKLRPVSPVFYVHAGYMFDVGVERAVIANSLPRGNIQTPDVDLNGLVLGGELGATYWISKVLRVGPFVGFDLTFLHRSTVSLPQSLFPITDETRQNPLFSDSGSGTGYIITFGLRGTADVSF